MFTKRGEMGMVKVKQKTIIRNPEETLTTSPAIIVDKNDNMRVTMSALHRHKSKRIQKHSEK